MSEASRSLRVTRILDLAAHLRRVVLVGPGLEAFPADCDGMPLELRFGGDGAPTRTYSVSGYDAGAHELTLDFVLHGEGGPATAWARTATPGAALGIVTPPGSATVLPGTAFLLAGDTSAIGLFSAVLRHLPRTARGALLIETSAARERIVLERPGGIAVRWLVRNSQTRPGASTMLVEEIHGMEWDTPPTVLLAGEDTLMRSVRHYLMNERDVPAARIYTELHWKDETADEAYRDARASGMLELARD